MESPKHLSHKPIVSVNNYDQIDASYKPCDTDVRALSIGFAQYNNEDISLKVWRHTGSRWSWQSEELPIHRNLDLSILFVESLIMADKTQSIISRPSNMFSVDRVEDLGKIREYYRRNKDVLYPRLKELKDLIGRFLSND